MIKRLILAVVLAIALVVLVPVIIVYVTAVMALIVIIFAIAFALGVPITVTKNGQPIGYYKYGKFHSTLKGTSRRIKNPSCIPHENEK